MQAPVVFELKESPTGGMGGLIVRAKNKNTFSSSANLLLSWRVLLDGVPLLVGDPAQRGLAGWYPGGSVAIAPQVPHHHCITCRPLLAQGHSCLNSLVDRQCVQLFRSLYSNGSPHEREISC